MNIFKKIYRRLWPVSNKQNVTGVHEAIGWDMARSLAFNLNKKISRFNEKPDGWFVEWDDTDRVFREGIKGSKTRRRYVINDYPADYVSCDWYIVE